MIFKVFVQNLSDRLLHIAKQEASHKGYYLKKVIQVDCYTILSICCQDEHYLPNLVDTLETDRHTTVFAIKATGNKYIDFRNISPEIDFSLFSLDALSVDKEEKIPAY